MIDYTFNKQISHGSSFHFCSTFSTKNVRINDNHLVM